MSAAMETQALPGKPAVDYHSTVDTSRPFRSVKEAVAIFGEKIFPGGIYYSTKPVVSADQQTPTRQFSPTPMKPMETTPDDYFSPSSRSFYSDKGVSDSSITVTGALRKLETELEETKMELQLLKERESETEVALASLNAELHMNMSKIAKAEAAAAAKAAVATGGNTAEEMMRRRQSDGLMEETQTLAQILSFGEKEGLFGEEKKKKKKRMGVKSRKRKPIVPLLGDLLFSWRKESQSPSPKALHNPLYSSAVYLN